MKTKIVSLDFSNVDKVYETEVSCFLHPWTKQSFIEEINNPLAKYFVLLLNDEPVGYVGLWHILDEGHITNIAIKKEHQGKGLSHLLIKEIIDYKNNNHLKFLTLEVRESNIVARKLYEKYNFKIIGERKKYYENNETAILYSLEG